MRHPNSIEINYIPLCLNDQVTMGPKAIANGFNNFFVNIGPTLVSMITTGGIFHRIFVNRNPESFSLETTNTHETKEVISKLIDGAPGRNNLRCMPESVAQPRSKIANLSFEQSFQ